MNEQISGALGFWVRWVLAHLVAFGLVRVVGDGRSIVTLPGRTRTIARGAVVGVFVAVMQWVVLRQYVSFADDWAVVTVAGYAVGFGSGEVVESAGGRRALGQVVFGGVVGATQAFVLQHHIDGSSVWWVLTCMVCLGGTDTVLKYLIRRRGLPVRLAVVLLGVMIGGGTGGALVWFLP